jgi:hypothetical protein
MVRQRTRRFVHHFHGEDIEPGRPRTLRDWEAARPLPAASCACYGDVTFRLGQVRGWLNAGKRNVTYAPTRPIM